MDIHRCRQKARHYIDSNITAKSPREAWAVPNFDELQTLSFPHLVEALKVRDGSIDMDIV